jgi:type II secretory pathway predicted ATPase ExeA
MRFFNNAGPCNPNKHYMLPATERLIAMDVLHLIEQEAYFVVHAPRQTGKTTAMHELAKNLTASGKYVAVLVSMEVGAGFPDDTDAAEKAILSDWRDAIRFALPQELHPPVWIPESPAGQRIGAMLAEWSQTAPRPLVLFLDEIDALKNDVLISVLRQLRSGYFRRPEGFPASLALIGLRDVRDYKVASGGGERLASPSPFNIATRSITLRNFIAQEVVSLLQQHSDQTGQMFMPDALAAVFEQTQGQPWLVNSLAKIATEELVQDRSLAIEASQIEQAKEILIQRRQTHLDQLADKLRQPRVRRVIEPILAGSSLSDIPQDDIDYLLDLGLCRIDAVNGVTIANPIYREVVPRTLSFTAYASIPYLQPTWLRVDGTLDPRQLLQAFMSFWRQHGQPLLGTAHYHEIAPHLVMMAYLDRVSNGAGQLTREYAVGSDRMDLYLRYGKERLAIELKVWRDGKPDPLHAGLKQLDSYLAGLNLDNGWLVIFDQRSGLPPISDRTFSETAATPSGRLVTVIRG